MQIEISLSIMKNFSHIKLINTKDKENIKSSVLLLAKRKAKSERFLSTRKEDLTISQPQSVLMREWKMRPVRSILSGGHHFTRVK